MSIDLPLRLLSPPPASSLLTELARRPRTLAELSRPTGSPPDTTLRGYLSPLISAGAVEKRRHGGFPGWFDYRLTEAGADLVEVAGILGRWLAASPVEEVPLGSRPGKRAVEVLLEGWRAGMVQQLAATPTSLTRLAGTIDELSYPAVERRLTALRRLGMVEPMPGGGATKPVVATNWLRQSLRPLLAGWTWQRKWQPDETRAVGVGDVEAGLLLALPVGTLKEHRSGSCTLVVRSPTDDERRFRACATVELRAGSVAARSAGGPPDSAATVAGPPSAWCAATAGDEKALEVSGDAGLAAAVVAQIQHDLALP